METKPKISKFMITSHVGTIVGTFDGTLEDAHRKVEKITIETQRNHAMWQLLGESKFIAESQWKDSP